MMNTTNTKELNPPFVALYHLLFFSYPDDNIGYMIAVLHLIR